MAVRYRRNYKTWQVYWNNPFTGKRESVSFAGREEAEKEDSLVKHRLRFDRESFRRDEEPAATRRTLEEVYLQYLCEKQFNRKSLECQRGRMAYPLTRYGHKHITAITTDDLEAVKAHYLKDKRLAPATVHSNLSTLRTVLYWAVRKGYREPLHFPEIPGAQYKAFVPPTPEEVESIFAVAPPHIRRVIILGAHLGVRVGQCELFGLEWSDVDLTRCMLRVSGAKKNPNAPWREVPIREGLLSMFEVWRREDAESGCSRLIQIKGKPVKSIKTAWRNTLRRAGIARRIRPYDLRHAFGTELVAAGVDVGTVAKLMGHSSPVMLLKHYAFIMDKQKRAAVENLPDVSPMCRKNKGLRM